MKIRLKKGYELLDLFTRNRILQLIVQQPVAEHPIDVVATVDYRFDAMVTTGTWNVDVENKLLLFAVFTSNLSGPSLAVGISLGFGVNISKRDFFETTKLVKCCLSLPLMCLK